MVPTCERPAPSSLAALAAEPLARLASVARPLLATDDPEAVHDARVATRRLQQILTTLAPPPRAKEIARLGHSLRRVRRALGEWRNYDVTLEAVAARRRGTRSPRRRALWDLVREHLEERRIDEMLRTRRSLLDEGLPSLPVRLRAVLTPLVESASTAEIARRIRERAAVAWSNWLSTFATAEARRDVPSIHALRIATKRLRYRAELAAALELPNVAAVVEWARRTQQRLGDWHDRQVLLRLLAETIARPERMLADLELAQTGLAELVRERDAAPPDDPAILEGVRVENARAVVEAWLGEPPGARSPSIFTKA